MSIIKSKPNAYQNIPFQYQVSLGQFPKYSSNNKFGFNSAIGTSQEEIWNVGGIEAYLASAETINIVSTDINDDGDPASTGAHTLVISGLDNDWMPVQETITLNGTTNVLTTNSYIRVFRMVVTAAGTSLANEGTITATASSAGSVHALISPTDNQTLKINFSTPANKYGLITYSEIGTAKGDDCKIRFKVRPFGEVFQTKRILSFYQNMSSFNGFNPILIPPKADITITAESSASGVELSANIDYYLINAVEVTG